MTNKNNERLKNIPIMFYRLGWKDRMKDWSKDKKKKVLKEMSNISLEHDITTPDIKRKFKLKNVPSEEFTGLQLYAGMLEISQELGFPIKDPTDKLVKLATRKAEVKKREVV